MSLVIQNNSRRYTFDSVANLRLLSGQKLKDNQVVYLSGHTTEGTGGGDLFWDAASTATDNNGTIFKLADTTTGRFTRTDQLTIRVEDFGALTSGTAAANSTAIQAAIDYCETVVAAGNAITLRQSGDMLFDSTLTVQVSAAGRIPDLDFRGTLHYTGVDTQPAIVIGEATEIVRSASINLSVINDNQSDWTQSECIGVRLINAHSCTLISIRDAKSFTVGLECAGIGSGFVHNSVFLGDMRNNKYGLDLKPSASGWTNENAFYGGQFSVNTGINSTLARYGVRMGRTAEFAANNNVFQKPSMEMNSTDTGAGLTFGFSFENAQLNHVRQMRSEITEVVAVFDVDSVENDIYLGNETANSKTVTDNGSAGNVVLGSRNTAQNNSKVIYDIGDIKSRASVRSSSVAVISGLMGANVTTGAQTYYGSNLTIGSEDVTMTSGSIAYGAIVDTSEQKTFTLSAGYTGAGGRIHVICYDVNDVILSGSSPNYVLGTSNSILTVETNSYVSGADSTDNRTVKFHADVKRAFIGIRKGTLDPQFNSFRLLATDDPDYVAKPAILSKTPVASLSPDFRYGDEAPTSQTWKAGDMVWDVTPSAGGTIGWVCVTAGTPGTWKTFGAITA